MQLVPMTVRIPKDLHDGLKIAAIKRGITLQQFATALLTVSIAREKRKKQTPASAFGGDR